MQNLCEIKFFRLGELPIDRSLPFMQIFGNKLELWVYFEIEVFVILVWVNIRDSKLLSWN